MIITGLDPDQLTQVRHDLVDHGGNPVEPFVDESGGWPLRCCLRDSQVGDRLAIVAWNPFPWTGPYAETGPIVIHVDDCDTSVQRAVPEQFHDRRQLVRPYSLDHRIAYDLVSIVEADGTLDAVLEQLLRRDDVERVVVRNVMAGCYSFTATR
jgi:transposase